MVNSKKEEFIDDGKIEDSDNVIQSTDAPPSSDVSPTGNETSSVGSTGPSSTARESGTNSGSESGLTERLRVIFRDGGDGDLLLQQSDRENSVLQWLQALDLQVMGACRADERLKPLLKLNASSGVAEDRLLAHLNQHFEASEVGMLARCLGVPLVSIRVGKVVKQGTLLCPTATRGNLNLTLLPTSDLHISFIGDDGCTERLATLSDSSESAAVAIEEIPADNSGRSFLIRLLGSQVSYFWCSERSKLLGIELLAKMKDLLRRKPTLAQLTGISESRLDCFATHLRAYLLGSTMRNNTEVNSVVSSTSLTDSAFNPSDFDQNNQCSSASSKPSRLRHNSVLATKAHLPYQGSLSPRSNSFEEGMQRSMSLARSGARDKFRRLGDSHALAIDNMPVASASAAEVSRASQIENDKSLEISGPSPLLPLSFLKSLENSTSPTSSLPAFLIPTSHVSAPSVSHFSPHYCWCPPCASSLKHTTVPSQLPVASTESVSLPPLSSFSAVMRSSSSMTPSKPSLNLSEFPSLDFPAFLPDPPFINMPNSQQIPTFTPLICDPIVHIPVIDVCSSGQGYLVSAGAAISTTIPPLHPKFVNPLIPETESAVEKGARETLRLLISSTQTNPQLMDVLPAVLNSTDKMHTMLVAGSCLYSGTRDVDAVANSIAAMGLVPPSDRRDNEEKHGCSINMENQLEESECSSESFDDKEGSL
ncbi:PREDICTED: uncharacterized protein LOC104601212 [Nelumbo nucifera]|uniref:Uncharacterized protein LOC104601212 n=1 Tax=Nelumbo nucifera TaxID=4432 RepID=A0A1U8A841_NELNU|nr:PREDICTED: uncharacterized protein LOC104601212 [Nelumbo nucifera]